MGTAPDMREACRRRAIHEASRAASALEERWPRLRDALHDLGVIGVRAGCVETAASRAVRSQLMRSISARDATRLAEALGLAFADSSKIGSSAAPPGAPPLPKDVPLPGGGLANVEARGVENIPHSVRALCLSAAEDQEALVCWRQIEVACATENAADLRLWAEHAGSLGFEVSMELLFAKRLQAEHEESSLPKERPAEPQNARRAASSKVSPTPNPEDASTPRQCPSCGRCAFCQDANESVSKSSLGSYSPSSPCFGPEAGDEREQPNWDQSHSKWRMPRGFESSKSVWESRLDHSGKGLAPKPPTVPQPPLIPPDLPPSRRHMDVAPPPGDPPAGVRRREVSPPPGVPPGLREAVAATVPYQDPPNPNRLTPSRSSSKERLPKPQGFPPPPPLPSAPQRWSIRGRDRPGSAKKHNSGAETFRGPQQRDPTSMDSARAYGHESRGGQSRQRPSSAPGRGRRDVRGGIVRHE